MTDYLAYSQQVREQILARQDLLDKVRRRWLINRNLPEPDFIAGGTSNMMFRLGQLESGLWVAFREPLHLEEDAFYKFENYCQTAEEYQNEGKKVPKFAIGIQDSSPHLGLLVEDLTEGGKRKLLSGGSAEEWGHFEDNPHEKVYFDLDFSICKPAAIRFLEYDRMINLQ